MEEQAQRAIKSKRIDDGYDQALIYALRCKESGESILEVVVAELCKNGNLRKKLKTQFWAGIHARFDLTRAIFGALPAIPDDHEFAKDMVEAMLPAHAENPTERTIEPFERYLDWAPKHCQHDVMAMSNACVEGHVMRQRTSQQLMVALLNYFGRHELPTEMPELWAAVRHAMDASMLNHYKVSSLARRNYIQAHMPALQALFSTDPLKQIITAVNSETLPPVVALEVAMNIATGCCMFKDEAVEVRYAEFIKSIETRLVDLLGNGYADSEVEAFKEVSLAQAKALSSSGVKAFDKKASDFASLAKTLTCEIISINYEWAWRLTGHAKTLALSQNIVPRMPWEQLCFGKEALLPGVSETAQPPESLLRANRNARDACLALFDGAGRTPTLLEMKDTVTSYQKDLRSTDISFAQEISFLLTVADGVVQQKVRGQLIACFPSSAKPEVAFVDARKALRELKKPTLVLCSGPALQKEVDAIALFMNQLLEDQCPASALAPATSKFFAQVRELSENFLTTSAVEKDGLFKKPCLVRGKVAVELLYSEFESKGGDIDTDRLVKIKTFMWMLSGEQRKKVNAKIAEGVRQACNQLVAPKALTCLTAEAAASTLTSSSSGGLSTALVQATVAVQLAASKRKAQALNVELEASALSRKASAARLHCIFRGRQA